jgi:hypothetical protein
LFPSSKKQHNIRREAQDKAYTLANLGKIGVGPIPTMYLFAALIILAQRFANSQASGYFGPGFVWCGIRLGMPIAIGRSKMP